MRFPKVSARPNAEEDDSPYPNAWIVSPWFKFSDSTKKACKSAIRAVNEGHEKLDMYVMAAARLVAADATSYYKSALRGEKIEAYVGQRGGPTFSIRQYNPGRGVTRYNRTKECKAIEMWFRRNIFGENKKPKPKQGIQARIAEGVAKLGKSGRNLKRADAEKFEARINALLEAYPPRK